MKYSITTKKAYHETMLAIYNLMDKGEAKLTTAQRRNLAEMSVAVEKYEDEVLGLRPGREPSTIPEIVVLKMFERKMNQTKLAEELGLGKSKVSEILSGRRKPDIPFLKGIYKVFKIDAAFLLEHI